MNELAVVAGLQCQSCGTPVAADQRFCLECGVRCGDARSQFLDGLHAAPMPGAGGQHEPGRAEPPLRAAAGNGEGRNTLVLIAAVGVLLLALGVGVLIGRSVSPAPANSGPAEVVSVGAPAVAPTTSGSTPETGQTPTTSTPESVTPHTHGGASKSSGARSSSGKAAAHTIKPTKSSAGSGESNEQKSRNLPDVVSTG